MLYFTADTHFGSERALKLSKRPFSSVSEMDEFMIKNWNSKITDKDYVLHLGDFGNLDVLPKLNGKGISILSGNYERDDPNYLKKIADLVSQGVNVTPITKDIVFLQIWNRYEFKDEIAKALEVENFEQEIRINLCHEPSKAIKKNPKVFNLYGHIHGRQMVRKYGMDVGVDCHHFYPISMNDVMFYWNAILNHYDNEVFDE